MTVVVLGLDGASFELIDDWMADGSLPALSRIRSNGVATDLQSCLPPVTCPNWKCYATGTNPGKLGVFWWEYIDREERSITGTSRTEDFEGPEFWRFIDGESEIINLPTSYPPPAINGTHVAGGPGSEQTGYTNPPHVEQDLETEFDYQVHPEKLALLDRTNPESPCVNEIYSLIDQRFDVLEDRIISGDIEFAHLTVFYINVLHHFYWDHKVVKDAWKRIDKRIGRLCNLDDLEALYIMSDHGSNEIETEFRINTWLEREGYLNTVSGKSNLLGQFGLTRDRFRPLLARLGIEWWVRRMVPDRILNSVPSEDGRVKKSGKADRIDWERSSAVASGQGPVYVLSSSTSRRKRIARELKTKLEAVSTPDGNHPVETAHYAGDVYDGSHVASGPDLIVSQSEGVHIDGSIGADEVFEMPDTWAAENKDSGLFMATGESIATGTDVSQVHIMDIAPTVLHHLGYPIPERIDGSVRQEIFASGCDPAEREPSRTTVEVDATEQVSNGEDGGSVEDRLSDLGYLE